MRVKFYIPIYSMKQMVGSITRLVQSQQTFHQIPNNIIYIHCIFTLIEYTWNIHGIYWEIHVYSNQYHISHSLHPKKHPITSQCISTAWYLHILRGTCAQALTAALKMRTSARIPARSILGRGTRDLSMGNHGESIFGYNGCKL